MKVNSKNNQIALISVIIAAYNAEPYLTECLDSVKMQTYGNWECIIIDDGSLDNTFAVAKRFAEKDKRFKVFRQDNAGVSRARNFGLNIIQGDFVTFIDADDQYDCLFFETMLIKRAEADLIISGITNIDVQKNGTRTLGDAWTIPDMCFESPESLALYYVRNHKLLLYSNCNKLYSTNIIKANRLLFNEALMFGEDRVFNYYYLRCAKKVKTLSACFYFYYHRNRNSLSTQFRKFHITELLFLHQEKMQWLKDVLGDVYAEELENFRQYDRDKEINNAKALFKKYAMNLSESEQKEEKLILMQAEESSI